MRLLLTTISCVLAGLAWTALFGVAPASAATPVSCAELASAIGSATAGEVLQLPAGHCQVEATVANTEAFALEGAGGGGTVLEPVGVGKSILQSSENVRFTLSGLSLTGSSGAPAVLLTGAGEAVTLSGDTFSDDSYMSGYGAGVSIQLSAASTASAPTQLIDDTFSNDHASGGGGVALLGSSPLVISGSTFTGDGASLGGGGLVISSRDGVEGAVQIVGSTFGGPSVEAGDTSGAVGGGVEIALLPSQALTLSSNTFENDRVVGAHSARFQREGAGLFLGLVFEKTGYPVTQTHNVFTGNVVEATQENPSPLLPAGGAGEWISGLSVLSTADSFTGNRVAVNDGDPPEGGALGAFASGPVGSTPSQPAVFTGRDDLFSGNSTAAGGWGGAIYVGGPLPSCTGSCPGSSLSLDDSTVVASTIDAGAGSEGGADLGLSQRLARARQLDPLRQHPAARDIRVRVDPADVCVFRPLHGAGRAGHHRHGGHLRQPAAQPRRVRDPGQPHDRRRLQRARPRGAHDRHRRQPADPQNATRLRHRTAGDRGHGRIRVHEGRACTTVPSASKPMFMPTQATLGGNRQRPAPRQARRRHCAPHLLDPCGLLRRHGHADHRTRLRECQSRSRS